MRKRESVFFNECQLGCAGLLQLLMLPAAPTHALAEHT